jgi:hypothetical protein
MGHNRAGDKARARLRRRRREMKRVAQKEQKPTATAAPKTAAKT